VKPLLVYCTVPDKQTGKTIAKALVNEGLCACVNQLPAITSYYVYKGEFSEDSEELLLIKTDIEHFEALKARIDMLHPYDVPEIIATDITHGNTAYLEWLHTALR
jgi:periplasmic divalent cation tolerance protein